MAPGLAAAPQGHPPRRVAHAWGPGARCPLQALRPEECTWPLCPSPGLPVKQGPYSLLSSQTVVLNGKGRHTQSANCKGWKRVRLAHARGLSQADTPTDLVILCKSHHVQPFWAMLAEADQTFSKCVPWTSCNQQNQRGLPNTQIPGPHPGWVQSESLGRGGPRNRCF